MGDFSKDLGVAGYAFDLESQVWKRSAYHGIPYTDGADVEARIKSIVVQAKDRSVLSEDLSGHCTDWPTRYHLSATRANLLRPFQKVLNGSVLEIGAGCGAITRYLGECGANVVALEGSATRAAIARARTADLDNVTVVAENFNEFHLDTTFDIVTLIGVLEYAHLFSTSPTAAVDLLERARSFLKPGGKLILAIENRLGLKYFAGAAEDHVGRVSYGLEDQYADNQPHTYGKTELLKLLATAGYTDTSLLLPFPDYKFPASIITEKALDRDDFDAVAFAWQSVHDDLQLPAVCHFSPELVWRGIGANGLLRHMANSFLLVASPTKLETSERKPLAFHFSTGRLRHYCKETVFRPTADNTGIQVVYRAISPEPKRRQHGQGKLHFACPKPTAYARGELLSWRFIRLVSQDGWSPERVGAFLQDYLRVLHDVTGVPPNATEFPGKFIDAGPQNIVVDAAGHPSLIDTEWTVKTPIETGWLLWRSLFHLLHKVTRFGIDATRRPVVHTQQFIEEALEATGLRYSRDDFARFARLEAELQEQVTGVALTTMADWPGDRPLPNETIDQWIAHRQAEQEGTGSANAQVFWQTDAGFDESASVRTSWPPDGRERNISVRFPRCVHGRARIDPAEAPCLMVFSTISVETGHGEERTLPWPPAVVSGDAMLLSSGESAVVLVYGADPILEVDLPQEGAVALSWRACKIPVARATLPHLVEALRIHASRISAMRAELVERTHVVRQLEASLESQSTRVSDLLTNVEEARQSLVLVEQRKQEEASVLATLTRSLESRDIRISQLEAKLDEQGRRILSLAVETAALGRNLTTRNQTLLDLAASDARLQTEAAVLSERLDAATREITERDARLASQRAEAERQQQQLLQLRITVEQQIREISEKSAKIAAQSEDVGMLTVRAAKADAEVDRLDAKVGRLDSELGVRETRLQELDQLGQQHLAMIGQLRQALAQKDADIKELEAEIFARDTKVDNLGRLEQQHLATLGQLRQAVAQKDGEVAAANAAVEAANGMLQAMMASRGWRFSQRAQRLLDGCLPVGSLRQRVAHRAFLTLRRLKRREAYRLIKRSGLFDADWYRGQNPVGAARMGDPIWHYLEHGAREGRNPCAGFDGNAYLRLHADVAAAGANPLAHYLSCGEREGRTCVISDALRVQRSRFFDADWYRRAYPDIAEAHVDPIPHYLAHGAMEGRDPGPDFHTKWYLRMYPDVAASGLNPLVHFLCHGQQEGRLPRSPKPVHPGLVARACLSMREVYRRLPIRVETRTRHRAFVTRHAPWVIRLLRKPNTRALHPRLPSETLEHDASESHVRRLVLVSHAASRTGAPMLALHLAKSLCERQKLKLTILILEDGELAPEFAKYGEVVDLSASAADQEHIAQIAQTLYLKGYRQALCNTVLTGPVVASLKTAGFTVTALIHEMGTAIETNRWVEQARVVSRDADTLVFASTVVRDSFVEVAGTPKGKVVIRPQGNFHENTYDREVARKDLRRQLGLAEDAFIVLGMGYADRRKGIDTFVKTASDLQAHDQRTVFVWVGAIDPYSQPTVKKLLAVARQPDRIRLVEPTTNPELFHAGSDLFLLTSREDPFPTVVMMAMDAGLPVIGWRAGGGFVDLLNAVGGITVPSHSAEAFATAVKQLLRDDALRADLGRRGMETIREHYRFADYVDALTALAHLQPRTVSVIVPNYNYADYLPERLASIAAQTYPLHEIIVLDDCSTDNSVDVIRLQLKAFGMASRLVVNKANEGTFAQWQRGIEMATGELVWIAEADDSCEPGLVANLVPFFDNPTVGLAYAQSTIMDGDGRRRGTYLDYLEADGEPESGFRWRHAFVNVGCQEIREHLVVKNTIPNVSAAIMRRKVLLSVDKPLGGKLRAAGDWHAYVAVLEHCNIAYCPVPLNLHRCHGRTVVARQRSDSRTATVRLLQESLSIQNAVRMRHPVGRQTSVIARSYLNRVAQCNLGCNLELVHELAPALAALDSSGTAEAPARILFLSTNEAWGGSEVAVARAALHFAEEGYRVALCMRRFSSRPVLLDHITQDGKVTVFERDCLETFGTDATESFVLSFAADLLYLSNGHAFEGLDIMRWATEHDLPYVNFIPLPNDAMRQFQTDDSFAECRDLLKGSRAILLDHTPAKRQMDCLFNCSFRNLHVVRNDYDVSYDLPFTWPFEKAPKTFDIGFFGRMDCEHKGLDLLLGVLSMKKWITRPLRVLLYGQGPDLEWTREQIRQNRLESVLLKGYTDSLEHSLTAVQGIVMPSRMEGTPIALVDALLCHRMAIVTPVGGMPELVKDGVSGFIAKEASVEALDDCLERAWNRRQAWASMGKAAGEGVRRIVPAKPHLQAVEIIAPLVRLKEVSA